LSSFCAYWLAAKIVVRHGLRQNSACPLQKVFNLLRGGAIVLCSEVG